MGATLLAVDCAVVGAFSLHIGGAATDADLTDSSFWMGVTFLIAAGLALPISWLVADLRNIWCIPPQQSSISRISENPGDDKSKA